MVLDWRVTGGLAWVPLGVNPGSFVALNVELTPKVQSRG